MSHPYPKFSGGLTKPLFGVMAWLCSDDLLFFADEIAYPCPYPEYDLANLC